MIGNSQKNKRGFTLFYALLVTSLALSIGAAIFDITLREIDLSNAATQSQYAVYISDSGAECALYWDSKYINAGTGNNGGSGSAFATSTSDTLAAGANSVLPCGGIADITNPAAFNAASTPGASWTLTSAAGAATTTFTLLGATYKSQTPCAVVYVAKAGNPSITTITSHGYNTCASSNLQLERVFQVSY